MKRFFLALFLLAPSLTWAQSYLPEPTTDAANARSQAECVLQGCQGITDLWWSVGTFASPQNSNQAYLIIQPSGDYGPSPSENGVAHPLSPSEMSALLSVAQVSPSLSAQVPDQTATVGQAWTYALLAGTFTDPRGETMTYTIWQGPDWLTLSPLGTFTGTPPAAGSWTITVTATDQSGFSNSVTFSLTAT